MKKGISLIVLVITIVVLIILAAAVILSLGKSNPINSSRVAEISQDKDSIESAILVYIGSIQAKTLASNTTEEIIRGNTSNTSSYGIVGTSTITNKDGKTLYNIDKTKYEKRVNKLPNVTDSSWYVDAQGKVYLVYEKTSDVPNWMLNDENQIDNSTLCGFVIVKGSTSSGFAQTVANNPSVYYGATVTNYSANGISDWKIFHSDGENIYLISSDYIPVDKIPKTKGGAKLENTSSIYPKAAALSNAVSDNSYATGSGAIDSSNPARKWLTSYLNNYSSTGCNMKAVAYLMDTSVWNIFKDNMAEYVLGGPTVEMLMVSYSNRYNVDYQASATSATGYKISRDGGTSWAIYYSSMLSTSDLLYVITSKSNADRYWLASPSADGEDYIATVLSNGSLSNNAYNNAYLGFRPVVCLKSEVNLIENDDGSVTIN